MLGKLEVYLNTLLARTIQPRMNSMPRSTSGKTSVRKRYNGYSCQEVTMPWPPFQVPSIISFQLHKYPMKSVNSLIWQVRKPRLREVQSLASVQFSSVTQSCLTLCDPMNHSTPGLPVHHRLPEFTQTHAHQVSDAIQPSHSLTSPPPAPNPSQHQGLFQWVNSSHEVAKVLEFQLQHQSFQWTPRTDLLQDGLVGFPCNPRDSQESSPIPQFKSIDFLVLSFLHSPTLTSIHDHWKNHSLDQMDLCW